MLPPPCFSSTLVSSHPSMFAVACGKLQMNFPHSKEGQICGMISCCTTPHSSPGELLFLLITVGSSHRFCWPSPLWTQRQSFPWTCNETNGPSETCISSSTLFFILTQLLCVKQSTLDGCSWVTYAGHLTARLTTRWKCYFQIWELRCHKVQPICVFLKRLANGTKLEVQIWIPSELGIPEDPWSQLCCSKWQHVVCYINSELFFLNICIYNSCIYDLNIVLRVTMRRFFSFFTTHFTLYYSSKVSIVSQLLY